MQPDLFHSAKGCRRVERAPLQTPTTRANKIALTILISLLHYNQLTLAQQSSLSFPGVTRELASFCSARPSLSIDLAPMIVHVKKNTSFNYKLYLFSQDDHVFQTGQIVPRDDFRIHSFPVKLKHLNEFLPNGQSKLEDEQNQQQLVDVYQLESMKSGHTAQNHHQSRRPRLVRVPSSSFNSKRFFARVPLVLEPVQGVDNVPTKRQHRSQTTNDDDTTKSTATTTTTTTTSKPQSRSLPFDVQGDELPGDHHNRHDVALAPELSAINSKMGSNANEHIEFDRDDQLAILGQPSDRLRELNRRHSQRASSTAHHNSKLELDAKQHHQTMVMPVGSFSSFRVNTTYLARKDFGQSEAEVVRLRIDARRFQVSRVDILTPLDGESEQIAPQGHDDNLTIASDDDDLPESDDYAFLSHKLLRDKSVRLTAINQIYEDWITRNHYTIVYIQRRLNEPTNNDNADILLEADELVDRNSGRASSRSRPPLVAPVEVVTERLVFRGSSIVLLGADQLNYPVKASAFITEKNGLHYYLEFLANGKFHLGAIDWSKRPFKFIDSQRFPIKPTRTQFDNEELLLCPPSVCYSDQPVDELVAYGRLSLTDKLQREATILAKSSSSPTAPTASTNSDGRVLTMTQPSDQTNLDNSTTISHQSESISLDNLIEAMRTSAGKLDVRLHLRDWTWQMAAQQQQQQQQKPNARFVWHYEWARRNELKVTRDSYGFALAGHEIDASYRVFNELYLISANHLISINYTLANETVTSVHQIGDEFPGLSSNLLDPITGAFYDRYSNQIYFFKGDRYVGYDYATKRPLEDFLLPPAVDDALGGLNLALLMQPTATSKLEARQEQQQQQQLVSSLPVVGILGQQHQVDAIYHDLSEDLVYVFSAMKFYTHKASDFKDGAFRAAAGERSLEWHCTNERFFAGCRFDAAYPNPCRSDNLSSSPFRPIGADMQPGDDVNEHNSIVNRKKQGDKLQEPASDERIRSRERESRFSEEQQKKLRSIAARGGLMDFLLENTLVAHGAARAFGQQDDTRDSNNRPGPRTSEPEQIVVYLLIAMVLVTVLITMAMIMIALNWARLKVPNNQGQRNKIMPANDDEQQFNRTALGNVHGQSLAERVPYPSAITHYLNNQYQQRLNSGPYYYGPPPPAGHSAAMRRSSGYASGPLTSPPNMPPPPPPAPRRPDYSQTGTNLSRLEPVDSSMF